VFAGWFDAVVSEININIMRCSSACGFFFESNQEAPQPPPGVIKTGNISTTMDTDFPLYETYT